MYDLTYMMQTGEPMLSGQLETKVLENDEIDAVGQRPTLPNNQSPFTIHHFATNHPIPATQSPHLATHLFRAPMI